jgi:hypothetical protein
VTTAAKEVLPTDPSGGGVKSAIGGGTAYLLFRLEAYVDNGRRRYIVSELTEEAPKVRGFGRGAEVTRRSRTSASPPTTFTSSHARMCSSAMWT